MHDPQQSLTQWIHGLKEGQSVCAQRLHGEVYDRLVRLARRRMQGQGPRWADEEDVALSAFHSFCVRAAENRFPQLENRDDLWKILVKITVRKARDYLRRDRRQKRGGGRVRGDSVFPGGDDASTPVGLQAAADAQPTPELAAVVAEGCQQLLDCLGDESLAQIAVWKLEGFTDAEIGAKLGCVTRTVERKTQRIREKWSRHLNDAET